MKVALVGPCGVGKSTLAARLAANGYAVAQPAQEHSGVPDMWQRLSRPDVLVYLEASLDTLRRHRPTTIWTPERLATANGRLAHARRNADLILSVDDQTEDDTLAAILAHLEGRDGADPGGMVDPPESGSV